MTTIFSVLFTALFITIATVGTIAFHTFIGTALTVVVAVTSPVWALLLMLPILHLTSTLIH
jgi:hypothetical protein